MLTFKPVGTLAGNGAEIPAYDPISRRLFVTTGSGVDILDISTPNNPTRISTIDILALGAGANSVAVKNDIVAVAVEANNKQLPGRVGFFDTNGNPLGSLTVGSLPDMLTFTSDGTKVLVANEGEPNDNYTVDPEGSVSIVDISAGVENVTVTTASFTAFNNRQQELIDKGVRIFGPNSSVAQDLEPEYIAVSPDRTTAFVTLQENNAFAVVDIDSNSNNFGTVLDILPIGYKDHSRGQPSLEQFTFTNLPVLGTTATVNPTNPTQTTPGQDILLGGLSGLFYEGKANNGNLQFVTIPDRGPNGEPTDVNGDGNKERPFALPDYQARVIRFELNETTGNIENLSEILLTREDGITPITGRPNSPRLDETPVDLFGNLLQYDRFGADLEGVVVAPDGTFWMSDEYRPAIYHFNANGVLLDRFIPKGTSGLAAFSELVVFGDSLSDTGNLFNLSNGQQPPTPPYFQQRVSNGPLWIDRIAPELGINLNDVTNFAISGATTGTSYFGPLIPPPQNVGLLNQIDSYVASVGAAGADPDALYFVLAGSNDILLALSSGVRPQNVDVVGAVDNLETAVNRLVGLGATNIVIPNSVDLGVIPFTSAFSNAATQVTQAFNAELNRAIATLEATNPGLNIIPVDSFGLSQNVATNPGNFGFTNVTDTLITQIQPQNPEGFAFWDPAHPTTQYHALVAEQFQNALINEGLLPNYGTETLPTEYANRRRNRGFEALSLDTNNSILYSFIQTPLANPDRDTSDNSQIIRMLGINPANGNPVAEYAYVLEDPDFRSGGRVDKIADATFDAANDVFYVTERDSSTASSASKYVFATDLNNATNLLNSSFFTSQIDSVQAVPTNNSTATGEAVLRLNAAGDALTYSITVSGLDFGAYFPSQTPQTPDTADDVTRIHFHNAPRGENGNVVFGIINPNQDDDDLTFTLNPDGSTTVSGIWEQTDIAASQPLSNFLFDLQNARPNIDIPLYFNIHTTAFPGGEIRGQIQGATLEQLTADNLADLNVNAADKRKVTNLPSLGYVAGDKPEGLALVDGNRLAVLNDNDFGLLDREIPVDGTVPVNPNPTPVVLGLIDFPPGNTLDASNRDSGINLQNYPIFGMFQPDGFDSFEINGNTYYITANEGDSRDYTAFSEEARIADLTLDPQAFPNAARLQQDAVLGRLKVTTTLGDTDGDGDYDRLFAYGGRSFTIWDESGNLVFDAGDQFERITAQQVPNIFNSNGAPDTFDQRSDDKGPEPESAVTGVIGARTYAFIGLERIGGFMVYDVSTPTNPKFVEYIPSKQGDISPEGLKYIPPSESPNGSPLLVTANEESKTTTIYEIDTPTELIFGGTRNDNFNAAVPNSNFDGVSDIVFTGAGQDVVDSSGVIETVRNLSNRIYTGSGNDRAAVGIGDRVFAGAGNDIFDATANKGKNRVYGGDGKDRFSGGSGDRFFGGGGNDTFDLSTGTGNNRAYGNEGNDIFRLGSGDRVIGASGNDEFYVRTGGNNTMTGGQGADQFWIFDTQAPNAVNTVTDFEIALDVIGFVGSDRGAIVFRDGARGAIIALNNGPDLAVFSGIVASELEANATLVFF
ncbi:MAG: choice-of-anchor I family protein [Prochloraceae cyanobacterium]|nr:choice-of-anchor I family protein [Prochloraceae cyanobacterium]